jgi:hypothetical protein
MTQALQRGVLAAAGGQRSVLRRDAQHATSWSRVRVRAELLARTATRHERVGGASVVVVAAHLACMAPHGV